MTTAFVNGPVITGTGQILEHATVLVENDKIVKIAMGTDAGTPFNHHGKNLNEVKLLVEWCDFSPMEAIESATRIAAETLSLENQIGTIEEGKLADLILVAGNPLDDIGLLCNQENIHLVMQGGNLVKGSAA